LLMLAVRAAQELRSLGDHAAASMLLKRVGRFVERLQAMGSDEFLGVVV